MDRCESLPFFLVAHLDSRFPVDKCVEVEEI